MPSSCSGVFVSSVACGIQKGYLNVAVVVAAEAACGCLALVLVRRRLYFEPGQDYPVKIDQ